MRVQSRRTSIYSPSTCKARQRSGDAFPSPMRTGVEALTSPTRLPRTTTLTQTRRTETGSSSATTASTSPGQIRPPRSRCSPRTRVRLAASTATSTGTLRDGDRSSRRGARRRQNSLCASHARPFWPLPGWSASMTTPGRPTERGPVSVGVRSSPDSPVPSHSCTRGRTGSGRPREENWRRLWVPTEWSPRWSRALPAPSGSGPKSAERLLSATSGSAAVGATVRTSGRSDRTRSQTAGRLVCLT